MKLLYINRPSTPGPVWELGITCYHGVAATYSHPSYIFKSEEELIRALTVLDQWKKLRAKYPGTLKYHYLPTPLNSRNPEINNFFMGHINLKDKFLSAGLNIPFAKRSNNLSLPEISGIRFVTYKNTQGGIMDILYEVD